MFAATRQTSTQGLGGWAVSVLPPVYTNEWLWQRERFEAAIPDKAFFTYHI